MKHLIFSVGLIATLICVYSKEIIDAENNTNLRKFEVDYQNDTFLMDGKPFQYVSGSFHYFRALPETWRTKLRTMRAAGLNAVSTYVEWFLHNPKDGVYNWEGIADLVKFIEIADEEDLYVILRPGPYICAEREMGGLPFWLLNKYPGIELRTADKDYLNEIRIWYTELMPRIETHLYGNGGRIIMVQVENEYGSFKACDKNYTTWLRDETEKYVNDKALLFTTDGPGMLSCGSIPNVFATIDFGASSNIKPYWEQLRKHQPKGPLVNSEYYPGWLTHWQENFQRVDTVKITKTLKQMLDDNANVNFYMFFGGTNFGFTAGANDNGPGKYTADITSYDYDAPMTEAGDPTPKFFAIREAISEYFDLPDLPLPTVAPKMKLGYFTLRPIISILSNVGRRMIGSPPIESELPLSFEELNQYSGFVLYETKLPLINRDPVILTASNVHDRGYVYIDRNYVGVLSRENQAFSIPISLNNGEKLQILVENQGRINYNIPNDFKGILGEVFLDKHSLRDWTMTGFPLDNYDAIESLINSFMSEHNRTFNSKILLKTGPTTFYSEIEIMNTELFDTYLDPTGWGKGIVYVNGFNIGRYWPTVGPQITLYVPKEILKKGKNIIVVVEYQTTNPLNRMEFIDVPNLG